MVCLISFCWFWWYTVYMKEKICYIWFLWQLKHIQYYSQRTWSRQDPTPDAIWNRTFWKNNLNQKKRRELSNRHQWDQELTRWQDTPMDTQWHWMSFSAFIPGMVVDMPGGKILCIFGGPGPPFARASKSLASFPEIAPLSNNQPHHSIGAHPRHDQTQVYPGVLRLLPPIFPPEMVLFECKHCSKKSWILLPLILGHHSF